MEKHLELPLTEAELRGLRAGDAVTLSGALYTARDAAHERMIRTLEDGGELPISMDGAAIYYAGPSPAPPGAVIGSCGPTTSGRMDRYTPALIERGLRVMIGKGQRSREVIDAMKTYGAVYFGAIGGAGALIAGCVREATLVAYDDLGTEAIRRLTVENMPLTVVIDAEGRNLYDQANAREA